MLAFKPPVRARRQVRFGSFSGDAAYVSDWHPEHFHPPTDPSASLDIFLPYPCVPKKNPAIPHSKNPLSETKKSLPQTRELNPGLIEAE